VTTPDKPAAQPERKKRDKTRRAFLHVGAPKTGTTYIQGVLWSNRSALKEAGLHVVGASRGDHYRGGHDLRGVPYDPKDPRPDWTGAWDVLAGLACESDAPNVVISDEHLAALTPEQVERAVRGLKNREVHVVYATRNLARLLPSEWQEFIKHGSHLSFEEWTKRVFNSREKGPGKWFWSVHDPVGVIDRWSTHVPIERVHVITLPLPGADKNELWRRFCGVVGVDPEAATEFEVAGNDSLGVSEAELLRRVNAALPDSFPLWHQRFLGRDVLATKILSPRSRGGKPQLPESVRPLVLNRSEQSIDGIKSSGCDLVGDLSEVTIDDDLAAGDPMPSDGQILDASVDAIAALLVRMGRMRDDRRKTESRLRRQMRESAPMVRTRTRLAGLADRTRLGSKALDRYRSFRMRANAD
jgi:hypothetical protein